MTNKTASSVTSDFLANSGHSLICIAITAADTSMARQLHLPLLRPYSLLYVQVVLSIILPISTLIRIQIGVRQATCLRGIRIKGEFWRDTDETGTYSKIKEYILNLIRGGVQCRGMSPSKSWQQNSNFLMLLSIKVSILKFVILTVHNYINYI